MINLTRGEAEFVRDVLWNVIDDDVRVEDLEEAIKIIDSGIMYQDLSVLREEEDSDNTPSNP